MQLENFLRDEGQHGLDAIAFWQHKNENTSKYPALKSLAMRVLCVCAKPGKHHFSATQKPTLTSKNSSFDVIKV